MTMFILFVPRTPIANSISFVGLLLSVRSNAQPQPYALPIKQLTTDNMKKYNLRGCDNYKRLVDLISHSPLPFLFCCRCKSWVQAEYKHFLGRAPSAASLTHWVKQCMDGCGQKCIARELQGLPHFQNLPLQKKYVTSAVVELVFGYLYLAFPCFCW